MSINLDTVLTVAIGDLDTQGVKLTTDECDGFKDEVYGLLNYWGDVVADAEGIGTGSDGDNAGVTESTHVFVAINVARIGKVRKHLASILRTYGQSSACFAIDPAHEPCFNTPDGDRPLPSAAEARAAHYCDVGDDSCSQCGASAWWED